MSTVVASISATAPDIYYIVVGRFVANISATAVKLQQWNYSSTYSRSEYIGYGICLYIYNSLRLHISALI